MAPGAKKMLFVSQDLWRVQGGPFASRSASSLLCALISVHKRGVLVGL